MKIDIDAIKALGKPAWRDMLRHVADLHVRSVQPARRPLPHPWEEIGPGYCYGPAFGHFDIVHQVMDTLPYDAEHARLQLLNNLANQQDNGFLPGAIWMRETPMPWNVALDPSARGPSWNPTTGHPPLWPVAADALFERTADRDFLATCLKALRRQLAWFDAERKAEPEGYFYLDVLKRCAECGMDQSVRFKPRPEKKSACVDATSHVAWCFSFAADWAKRLGADAAALAERASTLADFVRSELYDDGTGWFFDHWLVRAPQARPLTFEGMWPMVCGLATDSQARRVIDDHLLNPEEFFAEHPITTAARNGPSFQLRMWRGPAWNSMTWWAAGGCCRCGRGDAACLLVERALDASAAVFDRTGTVWEFYHPDGGDPTEVQRKPDTPFNQPCREYLGHNPLLAMARIYDQTKK